MAAATFLTCSGLAYNAYIVLEDEVPIEKEVLQ